LPAIAIKHEPIDEEEERRNQVNAQIAELQSLLEQAEERARVAEQDATTANADMVEWMEKAADYEAERVTVENDLTDAEKKLTRTVAAKSAEKRAASAGRDCRCAKAQSGSGHSK
ncbi:hypothetical protein PENTCL1PPCAC_8276, partial [Pristionchus entomophagus]